MSRNISLVVALTGATLMMNRLAFGQPVRIIQDDIPCAAPFFADVDGDGRKDLLVGQHRDDPSTGARVRLFRNIGTTKVPLFDDGTFLQAGGADASCNEFCRTGFGPQLVDFNGDGVRDLITGAPYCQLFVFPGRNAGGFDAANTMAYVTDKHQASDFHYNVRLFAHDWDSDGDLDLLVPRIRTVWLIRNNGDLKTPQFALPVELPETRAETTYFSAPFVADWNNDGRDDLILGRGDGSVVWLQNSAERGAEPELAPPVILVEPGVSAMVTRDANGDYDRPAAPTRDIRVCVADYNDDGRLDLLLGDAWILTSDNQPSVEQQERQARHAAFAIDMTEKLEALQKSPPNETIEARAAREASIATQKVICAKALHAANVADT